MERRWAVEVAWDAASLRAELGHGCERWPRETEVHANPNVRNARGGCSCVEVVARVTTPCVYPYSNGRVWRSGELLWRLMRSPHQLPPTTAGDSGDAGLWYEQ
jgi:hypothetical protein